MTGRVEVYTKYKNPHAAVANVATAQARTLCGKAVLLRGVACGATPGCDCAVSATLSWITLRYLSCLSSSLENSRLKLAAI